MHKPQKTRIFLKRLIFKTNNIMYSRMNLKQWLSATYLSLSLFSLTAESSHLYVYVLLLLNFAVAAYTFSKAFKNFKIEE